MSEVLLDPTCPNCGGNRLTHPCRCLVLPEQVTPEKNWTRLVESMFNDIQEEVYRNNHAKGFWPNWAFGLPEALDYLYGCKVGLIHTEVSEMMEALRSVEVQKSEKIPGFTLLEEESADAIIRILDLTGSRGLKIGAAIMAKLEYNKNSRPHKHGKRF